MSSKENSSEGKDKMPRIPDDNKRARLDRVYILLKQHEDGLTSQEIAGHLNLERRTVELISKFGQYTKE